METATFLFNAKARLAHLFTLLNNKPTIFCRISIV